MKRRKKPKNLKKKSHSQKNSKVYCNPNIQGRKRKGREEKKGHTTRMNHKTSYYRTGEPCGFFCKEQIQIFLIPI